MVTSRGQTGPPYMGWGGVDGMGWDGIGWDGTGRDATKEGMAAHAVSSLLSPKILRKGSGRGRTKGGTMKGGNTWLDLGNTWLDLK